MKQTKHILAALLTLALAFSLALPAMAAVNWDDFRIIQQPQNLNIRHGESFTLSVEVDFPAGVVVTYMWILRTSGVQHQMGSLQKTTDKTSVLQLDPSSKYYPPSDLYGEASSWWDYYVRVIAFEEDATVSSKTLTSETVRVTTEYDFVVDIPKQPQNLVIKNGDGFTLGVQATAPAGVEFTYQWYHYVNALSSAMPLKGATSPDLHLEAKDSGYPSPSAEYYCKITAIKKDSDGNILSSRTVSSDDATVTAEKTFGDKLYGITIGPFVSAAMIIMTGGVLAVGWTLPLAPLLIPLVPFVYLFYVVEGFIAGFKDLF
ncbi:MAG: hypothetical protein FWC27_10920 [Firmicutes bacterium]|nr:hypothetical protein [Bacillota bacterium]